MACGSHTSAVPVAAIALVLAVPVLHCTSMLMLRNRHSPPECEMGATAVPGVRPP